MRSECRGTSDEGRVIIATDGVKTRSLCHRRYCARLGNPAGGRGGGSMTLRFGVFDHIEPVPGLRLDRIYRERLLQIERREPAGFYAYHLAEHHTPAVHSLAPSQNVFLAAVAQRTRRLRFGPCVYVL